MTRQLDRISSKFSSHNRRPFLPTASIRLEKGEARSGGQCTTCLRTLDEACQERDEVPARLPPFL